MINMRPCYTGSGWKTSQIGPRPKILLSQFSRHDFALLYSGTLSLSMLLYHFFSLWPTSNPWNGRRKHNHALCRHYILVWLRSILEMADYFHISANQRSNPSTIDSLYTTYYINNAFKYDITTYKTLCVCVGMLSFSPWLVQWRQQDHFTLIGRKSNLRVTSTGN